MRDWGNLSKVRRFRERQQCGKLDQQSRVIE
jgi:hypothetical protein